MLFGCLLLCFIVSAQNSRDSVFENTNNYESLWRIHKSKYRINGFSSVEEEEKRLNLFKISVDTVESLNRQYNPVTYFSLNFFADLTEEEKKPYFSGFTKPEVQVQRVQPNKNNVKVPASIDWRTKGAVTPIKNQGQCGSSPYFSAVVSMEGAWEIAGNKLVSLSEQQIVDCDNFDQGCNGGWMIDAFQTVINEGGIESEADYPYFSGNGSSQPCQFNPKKIVAKFSSYVNVTAGSEQALMEALTIAPVASAVDATGFQFYQSGVYSSPNCTSADHGIGIVGYGTTATKVPYYILKNSWGTDWGMDGYIYLFRGSNMCEIANFPSYVVV